MLDVNVGMKWVSDLVLGSKKGFLRDGESWVDFWKKRRRLLGRGRRFWSINRIYKVYRIAKEGGCFFIYLFGVVCFRFEIYGFVLVLFIFLNYLNNYYILFYIWLCYC